MTFVLAGIAAVAPPVPGGAATISVSPVQAETVAGDDNATVAARTTGQIEALGRALRADPGRRDRVAGLLPQVAEERRAALLGLLPTNPAAVTGALLPDDLLAVLAPVAAGRLERRVTVSGRFSVFHRDDAEGQDTFVPQVSTPSGQLSIYTTGRMPDVKPGATVSVSGYQLDQSLIAYASGSSGTAAVTATSAPAPTTPLGPLNVAVILGSFSNSPGTLDPSVARAAFQGSPGQDVDSWYSEVSYGQSSLTPSFFGPYTIPGATAGGACPNLGPAGSDLMSAASPSLTYSQYRRVILVFSCTGYGASTNIGETSINTPQGTITGGLTFADASALGDRATYAHELSHNLGSYHAGFYVCQPSSFLPPTRFDDGCSSAEYGDEFDTLGSTLASPHATPHLGPVHKANAGWLSAANYPTLSSPGTYTYKLLPYEAPASGVLALNIPRGGSGTAFTLEYRQPTGFDSWMAPSDTTYCGGQCTATKGPRIELAYPQTGSGGGSDTQAIDTTPGSIQSNTYYPITDNRDGALLAGKTFTDPEYGISITTQAADPTGATVQVTIPPTATCTRQAPTVALLSPTSQSAAPGQTLSYTVSVTNHDLSTCPAEEYKYSGGQLLGNSTVGATDHFTAVGSPDVFNLSPGASTNVTVSLTPDATVVAGSYGFQLTSSGGIGTIDANALSVPAVKLPNVTFQVVSPADTTAPSAPTNLAARALGSGAIALSWAPSTDNVGIAGYKVLVDGAYLHYTAPTALTVYNLSAGTSHTFSVQAFDRQSNLSPAAATTSATTAQTDATAPTAPGNVTATATDRSISVSWQPSSDNTMVTGYLVGPFDTWVPPGTASTMFSNLATNTTYQIRIEALDGSGNASAASITVTTAFAGTAAPTQPTLLYSPSARAGVGTQLSWNASSGGAGVSGYHVYRNGRRWATVAGPSYTDPAAGQYPRAGYQYAAEAYDAAGNVSPRTPVLQSIAPGVASGDTTPPTGALVTAPTAGATVSGTVTISASPTDDTGVSSVDFSVDGVYASNRYAGPYTYAWNSAGVSDGSHTLYVRAYDAAGNYSTGGITTVTVRNTAPDTTPPTPPSGLTATATSSNQVNLAWAASSDNIGVAGYYVYRNGATVASATGTGWSDTGLSPSTTHSYSVAAYDAAGNLSTPSGPVSVTTPAAPPPRQATTGTITGAVTSRSSGAALANVTVSYTVSGAKLATSTSSSGLYTIDQLPPGSYTLTFSLRSHKTQSATGSVTAGQVTTVNVAM